MDMRDKEIQAAVEYLKANASGTLDLFEERGSGSEI